MNKTKLRIATREATYENNVDIFRRGPEESAKTICILGRSYSGKTVFLVQQLNKIGKLKRGGSGPDKDRPMYDKIILFTESLNAEPLEDLSTNVRVTMIQGYVPKIVQVLKQINNASDNGFRFLVLMDDVVSGIRTGTFVKQILTMRNSQISTCILIQHAKLISPASRNSLHHFYITGLKPEEWEYLIKSFMRSLVSEVIGDYPSAVALSVAFKEWVGDDIVHYDQRRDELSFIERSLDH